MGKKKSYITQRIISLSLVLCMLFSALPQTIKAEETGTPASGSSAGHLLVEDNEQNEKQLIMSGEYFYIEPKFVVSGEGTTRYLTLYNACLKLGDDCRVYDSKLVRSTPNLSGIITDASDGRLTNTYNIWQLGQAYLSTEALQQVDTTIQQKSPVGYINQTDTPIVVEQIRTSSMNLEGKVKDGDIEVQALSQTRSDCTIRFYEPYYTLSYQDLLEGEEEGLPDRYYVQNEKQTIKLPVLARPANHFVGWGGGLGFADPVREGDTLVYTFDWEHNLVNAGYDWGDATLYPIFEHGYTITFHPNGGTIDDKESAIYELDKEGETFFNIADHVPVREGYTFLGWCSKPSAYYDSLITDTSSYDWMNDISYADYWDQFDVQLYAKWKEDSDEELEKAGYRLDETTGKLEIITEAGADAWKELCETTEDACKEKVTSVVIEGDATSVGMNLLSGCANLKKVELARSVDTIWHNAFQNCPALQTVEMPGVTNINQYAFEDCTALTKVTFSDALTDIGVRAFAGCSNLKEVVFEKADEEERLWVSADAFQECDPDLAIQVNPVLLEKFRTEYMPDYASQITDGATVVPKKQITSVDITNATISYQAGEAPKATAAVSAQDASKYEIEYEYWEEMEQTANGVEPVAYWYSDVDKNNAIPADKRITTFEAGKSYMYSIGLKVKDGYAFSGQGLTMTLNGAAVDSWNLSISGMDNTNLMAVALKTINLKQDACAKGHTTQTTITKATTKADGKIVTSCSVCKQVLSTEVIPKASNISLSASSYTYNGKAKKPSVTVKDSTGKKLGTSSYTVTYAKGRKDVGRYAVTIQFKGNYSGSVTKAFTINPKAASLQKLTAGKKKLTVKWKKQTKQISGYQIQYSTDKKFKKM